jgi:hypothetical protein
MFRPPSAALSDYSHYADWIEACTLFRDPHLTSKATAADVLRDEGIIGTRMDDFFESDTDSLEDVSFSDEDLVGAFLDEVWQVIGQRRLLLKELHPFEITHGELRLATGPWERYPSYSTLLLADLWRLYNEDDTLAKNKFPALFEKLVEASKRGLLGGSTSRFGDPPDEGWPKGIDDRIRFLGELMSLETEILHGKTATTDNDRGLDVVSRLSLGDDGAASVVFLTQCATGKHWRSKTGEPSLAQWKDIFRWDATLVRSIAVPWSLCPKERVKTFRRFDEAVVLDRFRLLSGNPDNYMSDILRSDLMEWCQARVGELPKLS